MDDLIRRLLWLPERGSTLAGDMDHLHYSILAATIVGALAVGGLTLFFVVRHARRGDGPARTPRVEIPRWLEALLAGGTLLLFLVWFHLGFHVYARIATPPPDALDVYVVGRQWVWQFDPASGPAEVGRLHVPAGRPVRLLLTSRDVIHSFFVPAFRTKQDAVPGRFTESWFEAPAPGTFDIFCAEYCGTSHSTMLGQVIVLAPEEYERWLAGDESRGAGGRRTLAEIGRGVSAEKGCLRCHAIDATLQVGPSWRDLYGKVETLSDGRSAVIDEAFVAEKMMDPQARVARGFQPVMPAYQGQVDPGETAAIIEYMKSLSRLAVRRPAREAAPGGASPTTGGR